MRVILENAATSVVTRHRNRTDNNKMFSQPYSMNILRNKKKKKRKLRFTNLNKIELNKRIKFIFVI